jgi:arabinogalactan endo-1,4-beta-galactosidase
MKKLITLTLMTLLMAVQANVHAQKYVGGDISMLPEYEKANAQYYDKSGKSIDNVLAFFVEQGWNAARLRLFVDPSQASEDHQREGVRQDLEFVKALGKRIKDAGMTFMLDFHYSDTWTDPGKHSTPASWNSSAPDELATMLYNYTVDCLQQLKVAGATPDFIQVGNEITTGMLWPTGEISKGGNTWDNLAKYLKKGIQACREECPQAKIVIHTEMHNTSSLLNFYSTLKNYTSDYDVIGISYYPHFHGTLSTLNTVLNNLEQNYPDKKIQIVETAYYHKWYPDNAKYSISNFPNWPATEAGQQQFAKDFIAALNSHDNVDGFYWWWPEANEYGVNYTNAVTKDWCNYSLFDNETGKVMSALYELQAFTGAITDDSDVTSLYLVNPTFDSNISGWTNTNGTAQWRQNTWGALSNYCEFAWTGNAITNQEVVQIPTLPAGSYKLSVTCASDNGATGVFLIASDKRTEMIGTGGVESFSVEFNVTSEEPVKLGLKLENTTATWINFDNFYLEKATSTGIVTHQTSNLKPQTYYTLDGRQLTDKPTTRGIYIHNGIKVVIK